ncbi:MAG: hypothetical protein K2J62_09590 [Bacteroidales bacterium]|nr:hypothetical protein [Bacteroidales bacterium]
MASKVYRIERVEDKGGKVSADAVLDPGSDIFKGHFPGQPILPGVCSVQMLGEIMSEVIGKEVFINEVSSCKYLKTVDPVQEQELHLDIDYSFSDGKVTAAASGSTAAGEPYLKIKFAAIC